MLAPAVLPLPQGDYEPQGDGYVEACPPPPPVAALAALDAAPPSTPARQSTSRLSETSSDPFADQPSTGRYAASPFGAALAGTGDVCSPTAAVDDDPFVFEAPPAFDSIAAPVLDAAAASGDPFRAFQPPAGVGALLGDSSAPSGGVAGELGEAGAAQGHPTRQACCARVAAADAGHWVTAEENWGAAAAGACSSCVESGCGGEAASARVQERLQRARLRGQMSSRGAAADATRPADCAASCSCASTSAAHAAPAWSRSGQVQSQVDDLLGDAFADEEGVVDPFPSPAWASEGDRAPVTAAAGWVGEATHRSDTPSSLAKPPPPERRRTRPLQPASASAVWPSPLPAAHPHAQGAATAVPPPLALVGEDACGGDGLFVTSPVSSSAELRPMLSGASDAPPRRVGARSKHARCVPLVGTPLVGTAASSSDPTSPPAAGERRPHGGEHAGLLQRPRGSAVASSLDSDDPPESPDNDPATFFFSATPNPSDNAAVGHPRRASGPPRRRKEESLLGDADVKNVQPPPAKLPRAGVRRETSFSDPEREPPLIRSRDGSSVDRASAASGDSAGGGAGGAGEARACSGRSTPLGCELLAGSDCLSPDARSRCASVAGPVASYEQELLVAVRKFNVKPKEGVAYLQQRGFLRRDAPSMAHFLRSTKGLSKRKLGDYLGERGEPFESVLADYVRLFDFSSLSFVEAIRAFLSPFRLPGEAQKIDRIMCEFAAHYASQRPGVFSSADTAYVLGFSAIMLNTDAHSVQIKQKNRMSKADFVRNNRGIDSGTDLPAELLEAVYDDIVNDEIRTGASHALAFTRDCFSLYSFIVGVSSLYLPPPTCTAYPIAILLHDYCAIYAPPSTLSLYAIHHTILGMAISCKGQLTPQLLLTLHCGLPPPLSPAALAFTRYCHCQYCMVYGIHKGSWVGVAYCAFVVQWYCNSMSDVDGGGNQRVIG